ncbi:DNA repair protein RadA, partial [Escherichia coli]|nr:DNA repair protein RadA [Escherichia coli]
DHLKMLSETNVDKICQIAEKEQPRIMVIDSIQVMHVSDVQSSPGSVAQVRESATARTRYAKQNNVAVFIVGHVTKDGTL